MRCNAYFNRPKSSISSVISMSFPFSSLALVMLKQARTDAIINHIYGVFHVIGHSLKVKTNQKILTVELAMCLPTQILKKNESGPLMEPHKDNVLAYRRPNPYANTRSSSFSFPFSSKNLSGLKANGSG